MADAQTPPAQVPVRERGYTVQSRGAFWTDLQTEQTPELRWPFSNAVYEAMVDQDGQVSSTLAAIVTPILRAGWRIDGTGCPDEVVQHVAGDLGLPIVGQGNAIPAGRRRGRFSWTEHLQVAVPDHLQYGHAVFEQVYFPPGDDGLLHLRKLGYRPPRTIAAFHVAPDGGLEAVQQFAPGYATPGPGAYIDGRLGVTLDVGRLVVYVNQKKGGNWIGRSVLRPAYKHWLLKDRGLRRMDQTDERNGMGIPVYTASPKSTQEEIDAGEDIATAARSGEEAGVSLPNGASFDLKGVTGTLPDLLARVRYHDEQIARTMLANVLNLGQARGTGSWALGNTLNDVLSLAIEAIAENVRDTANQHVIEDLVDLNYGPDVPAPRLVFDEIGSKNAEIVGAIAQLVQAKVLRPDESLESFIRSTLGLPAYDGPEQPFEEAS